MDSTTKPVRRALLVAASVVIGICAALGYRWYQAHSLVDRVQGPVESAFPDEILVMRTNGGLLEVATVRAQEHFDQKFVYSVLGVRVGETIPHIRVPATYRYTVKLASEWPVRHRGDVFTVVAPAIKPSLPVAVDLSRMEKDVGGTWVLAPFTGTDDLNSLERGITARLGAKAASPAYLKLCREEARKTVEEFVRKWLVSQAKYQDAAGKTVRVRFADEKGT